jgi:small subunit ribosomal protein S3
MGHKTNPVGFRTGITLPWRSRWYATRRNFAEWLFQDQLIRRFLRRQRELQDAGISRIEIERFGEEGDQITVYVFAEHVGMVIGSQGRRIEALEQQLREQLNVPVRLKVVEVEEPEKDANIVARWIKDELERRMPYRRVIRMMADRVLTEGAKGVRIRVQGRLGGAEIARSETLSRGKLPLQTLRADVDYGQATAVLSKGTIGIKVWIYRGDRIKDAQEMAAAQAAARARRRPRRSSGAPGQEER